MRDIFINIGIPFLLLVLFYIIAARIWTVQIVRKIKATPKEEKVDRLNKMLYPFGFLYESWQDIIYSRLHPWQRELGYKEDFDQRAMYLSMVLDCEPVYFEYGGKRWLIEFWKGQYGMTTGAEIGVYSAETPEDFKPGDEMKIHYQSVADDEMIWIQYILFRRGAEQFHREGIHWWQTGFEPGLFSKPEELEMKVKFIFPTEKMCYAFYQGIVAMGYRTTEFYHSGKSLSIRYHYPKSKQPKQKLKILRFLAQYNNKRNCRLYQKRTKIFESDLDKITFISFRYPLLYRALIGFTGWRRCKKRKKIM